jgi:hypothetical protein
MRAVHASHAKYQAVVAEKRVKAALFRSIPSAADRTYADGVLVLVKYENRDIWDGPFQVVKSEMLRCASHVYDRMRGPAHAQ